MDAREVSIGGKPYTVARFKTYKAVLVGEVLKKVSKEVRQLFTEAAEFRREFREQNPMLLTRQVCHERIAQLENYEPPKDVDEEQLERIELDRTSRITSYRATLADMGDRGYLEMPQEPSDEQVMIALFPRVLAMREELAELLALLVTPDSDLKAEWHRDSVHTKLIEKGQELITESEPEEILALAEAAREVVGDQFRPLVPAVQRLWLARTESPSSSNGASTKTKTEDPTNGSPGLSTGSPPATDGGSTKSSSESPGESLSTSSGG